MRPEDFYAHVPRAALAADVARHGTPAYLYYRCVVERRLSELRSALGPRFDVLYAAKANSHSALLRLLAAHGVGFDVASGGELAAALEAGADARRVELTGPGKSDEELRQAIAGNVGSINVESLSELDRITELAAALGQTAPVGLRVNLRAATSAGIKMSGDTQFGLREDELDEALSRITRSPRWLRFEGLHVHQGSQILDARAMIGRLTAMLAVAAQLARRWGPMPRINFGGGFGVDYWDGQVPLDLGALAAGAARLLDSDDARAVSERCRFVVEPGRYLVAEAGVFAVSVRHVKEGYERTFAVADSGIHHAGLLAGGLGQVVRRDFRHAIFLGGQASSALTLDATRASNADGTITTPAPRAVVLAGPLCLPQDVLLTTTSWPGHGPQRGDVVCFFNCGAYGRSASPTAFLGHPPPLELLL